MVTTLRVVWIEIVMPGNCKYALLSPPCGWCGLKFTSGGFSSAAFGVTTLRVVWIEIQIPGLKVLSVCSHHLAGGVD